MFDIPELSSAPPDVVESELSEVLPNTKLNLKSESTHEVEREEDLPTIVTASIIVLGSLVTFLLAVILVILYFRYQKRTRRQPLKENNRFAAVKFCLSSGGYFPGTEGRASSITRTNCGGI